MAVVRSNRYIYTTSTSLLLSYSNIFLSLRHRAERGTAATIIITTDDIMATIREVATTIHRFEVAAAHRLLVVMTTTGTDARVSEATMISITNTTATVTTGPQAVSIEAFPGTGTGGMITAAAEMVTGTTEDKSDNSFLFLFNFCVNSTLDMSLLRRSERSKRYHPKNCATKCGNFLTPSLPDAMPSKCVP